MKQLIVQLLKRAIKKNGVNLKNEEIEKYLEVPPSYEMGDYAFPCFFLAKQLKKNPVEIAINIRKEIGTCPIELEDIQTIGPYINLFVDRKQLARNLIKEILGKKENFGKGYVGKGKKAVIEYSSPNIAKPFGIGHLRSTIIGNSIANICEFQGFKTIRINYLGDWGTQFGKLILGYEKFGDSVKLKKDPIKHLLEIYVRVNKKIYEEKSREWFKKLEQGNKDALRLWKDFGKLSIKEFNKIYSLLGVNFDVYSAESMYNNQMEKILEELNEKKLLKESEGALIIDLEKYNLGVCLIQKSDGTSLYATREIASAIERYNKYKFEEMIYEVGQEQKFHFKQIFKILELMGHNWAKNCVHVDHGLYLDKDGKKFATRKGKTIFMEDIFNETLILAKKEIKKRFPKISKKELEKRAHKVTIAAIFYGDLKNNRANNMIFDIKRFVAFEGDTGPYLLYSYARASSIIKKAKTKKRKIEINELEPKEILLVKKLSEFQETVLKSYNSLNPAIITNYSYELAQIFNEFYHACPVIGSEKETFRFLLVESFRQVLKNSLNLLGIETLEKM